MMRKEKKHTGYSKVKGALREKGLNYSHTADVLGLSHASLCFKINGSSDFYVQEALALADLTGKELSELFPGK